MFKNSFRYILLDKGIYSFIFLVIIYNIINLFHISDTLVFNIDEYSLTFDVLNKTNGLPIECSAWPGGTVQFLSYPIVLLKIVYQSIIGGLSFDSFTSAYADAYFKINKYILIIRYVNTCVFLVNIFVAFNLIWKKLNNDKEKIIYFFLFLILISNSYISILNWTATSDSMAFSFSFLSAIIILFSTHKYKFVFSGMAIGLSVACKVTFLINVPFFLTVLLLDKKWFQNTIQFLSFALISFIFVCPFVWTDTLRLLKSIIGNLSKGNQAAGQATAFKFMLEVVSFSIVGFFVLTLISLKTKRNFIIWIVTFGLMLLNLLIASKSGSLFPRYFVPLIIPVMATVLLLFPHIIERISIHLSFGLIFGIFLIQSCVEIRKSSKIIKQDQITRLEIDNIKEHIKKLGKEEIILVPYELIYEFTPICSEETFDDLVFGLENNKNGYEFFKQRNLSEVSYNTIQFALIDQEITLLHRLKIFKWNSIGNINIRFYSSNAVQIQRYGLKQIKDYNLKSSYYLLEYRKNNTIAKSNILTTDNYSLLKVEAK